MVFLEELLAPLATLLHVPIGALVFAALMVMGVAGHYAIYRIVRRLTKAADRTETQWDDVVLYAIFPPIQWVMSHVPSAMMVTVEAVCRELSSGGSHPATKQGIIA